MEWSPSEILEIHDITACAGFSHSQGQRCRSPLSAIKKGVAELILDHMSSLAISSDESIFEQLETLASNLLCSQRHEYQAQSLVSTWTQRILTFQTAQVEREAQELQNRIRKIVIRLRESSLEVPQSLLFPIPVTTRVPDEDMPIKTRELDAVDTGATSSASNPRSTTVYRDDGTPSVMYFDTAGNILPSQGDSPGAYEGAHFSDPHSPHLPPFELPSEPQAKDESQTPEEAPLGCVICLEDSICQHCMVVCDRCQTKFHESCMGKWLKVCDEGSVDVSCPCW